MSAPVAAGAPVPVMISFGDERRAEVATRVRTEAFDGPLQMLLVLIEQRQLDVLTVRLGDLAPAFLDALAGLETRRLPLLSAFVSVSAQLILIKSRALLPRAPATAPSQVNGDEGPDPEAELRKRLIEYRRYRDAGAALGLRAESFNRLFHREAAAASAAGWAGAAPQPVEALPVQLLVDALRASTRLVAPVEPKPTLLPRRVTMEQRVALIRRALRAAPTVVLQELLRDVRDRVVVAVTFMALLEMVKSREITIEQRVPWGPISVSALRDGG